MRNTWLAITVLAVIVLIAAVIGLVAATLSGSGATAVIGFAIAAVAAIFTTLGGLRQLRSEPAE